MRILYATGTAGAGGMTPVLLGLLRHLPRREVCPTVALPSGHPAWEALERDGVPYRSFSAAGYAGGLCRLIRQRRIQLVHSCDPAGEGGLAARRCGIPHLWELPGIPQGVFPYAQARGGASFGAGRGSAANVQRTFPALADLLADAVVVHCRDLARKLSRPSLRRKLHVIPPVSVDADSIPPRRGRPRSKEGRPAARRVAMVGNFYPAKRHLDFLRAAARIHREEPSVRFVIAGRCVGLRGAALRRSVRYRQRVVRAVRRSPLRGKAAMTRFHPAERFRWMQGINVLVTPSFEGLSQAMVEAAACAVPIVAARAGGQKDLLEGGRSGLLVPLGDPGAIARAVLRLLRDPGLAERLGRAARRRILGRFAPDRQARRFLGLYRRILRSSPPRRGLPHQGTRTP